MTWPEVLAWAYGSCAGRRYKPGDYVRVKVEDSSTRYRKPHLRTPGAPQADLHTWQTEVVL